MVYMCYLLVKKCNNFSQDLFSPLNIDSVHELSLGGNIPIEDVQRLEWKTLGQKGRIFFYSFHIRVIK